MSISSLRREDIKLELEKALKLLEQKGYPFTAEIRPILFTNLDRDRIDGFIQGQISCVVEYAQRVADYYVRLCPYIEAVQNERTDEVWEKLFEKLQEWTYNFLLRNNFSATLSTREIAMDCGTAAAITLLDAYFPYDIEFEPWAHIIARNACFKFFRNETKKSVVPSQNIVELKETLSNADDSILAREKRLEDQTDVITALGQLANARQQVIELYYFDEISLPQIAERMGKSVGAIHSLHFNALQDLRKILVPNRDNI